AIAIVGGISLAIGTGLGVYYVTRSARPIASADAAPPATNVVITTGATMPTIATATATASSSATMLVPLPDETHSAEPQTPPVVHHLTNANTSASSAPQNECNV